jgi:protein phosphatase
VNQDWMMWRLDLGLFVVADGMGGHNAGEVASHLAVDEVCAFIAESAASSDLTWPFGLETALSIDVNRLMTAVRLANRRIYAEGLAHEAFSGMGTTIVAALASDDRVALASVGDSRIYRWRNTTTEQLTRDDTWLASVLGASEAEAAGASHPLKHVLTRVVGTREDVRPSMRDESLRPGDRLLMCSDGVHGRIDAKSVDAMLGGPGSADSLAEQFVAEALARGTTDNATALVIVAE